MASITETLTILKHLLKEIAMPQGFGTGLVVRVWKGFGTKDGVNRYVEEHFAKAVLPQLREIDGFIEANVLVGGSDAEIEVIVATVWESIESVKAFAGENYDRAVVEPVVRDLLDRFDDHATHFTLALARGN